MGCKLPSPWFGLLLCLVAAVSTTNALKECIQPVRSLLTDEVCTEPNVPETICFQDTCDKKHRGSDACTVVTHAILADFEVFDVVMLHEGTCQSEISSGSFTQVQAQKLLPSNEELVGLQLNGTDIVQALEHGLDQFRNQGDREAYPRVAGLRFHVDFSKPYSRRVSQAEILTPGCRWKAIDLKKDYNVLTSRFLAEGGLGYGSLTRTRTRVIGTGIGVTDSFWFYATSTCNILDPFRRPNSRRQGKSCKTGDKNKTIDLKPNKRSARRSNRTITSSI
jgi:hypothetical protein